MQAALQCGDQRATHLAAPGCATVDQLRQCRLHALQIVQPLAHIGEPELGDGPGFRTMRAVVQLQ